MYVGGWGVGGNEEKDESGEDERPLFPLPLPNKTRHSLTQPINNQPTTPKTPQHSTTRTRRRTREERARAALAASEEGRADIDDIITSPVQLEVEVCAWMMMMSEREGEGRT